MFVVCFGLFADTIKWRLEIDLSETEKTGDERKRVLRSSVVFFSSSSFLSYTNPYKKTLKTPHLLIITTTKHK